MSSFITITQVRPRIRFFYDLHRGSPSLDPGFDVEPRDFIHIMTPAAENHTVIWFYFKYGTLANFEVEDIRIANLSLTSYLLENFKSVGYSRFEKPPPDVGLLNIPVAARQYVTVLAKNKTDERQRFRLRVVGERARRRGEG